MKRERENLQFDILLEQPLFVFFSAFAPAPSLILVTSTYLAAIEQSFIELQQKLLPIHQPVGSVKYIRCSINQYIENYIVSVFPNLTFLKHEEAIKEKYDHPIFDTIFKLVDSKRD